MNIEKVERNRVGTLDMYMKVKGMRKFQEFTVYPIKVMDTHITIQSETRLAKVDRNGKGVLSTSHQNGANSGHLQTDKTTDFIFDEADWKTINEMMQKTANNGVKAFCVTNSKKIKDDQQYTLMTFVVDQRKVRIQASIEDFCAHLRKKNTVSLQPHGTDDNTTKVEIWKDKFHIATLHKLPVSPC